MKILIITSIAFFGAHCLYAQVNLSPKYCEVFNSLNNPEIRAKYSNKKNPYKAVCIDNKKQDLSFSEMVDNYGLIKQSLKQNEADKFAKGLKAFAAEKIKNKLLIYTKLPGIKAKKRYVDALNHCIAEKESYLELEYKSTHTKKQTRNEAYIDYEDTIPFGLFQANNLELVLQAKSMIQKINKYKENLKKRKLELSLEKEKYKQRIKRSNEVNTAIEEIKDTQSEQTEVAIQNLENKLFKLAGKESWLFEFGRSFDPTDNFLDRTYELSSIGEMFTEDLPKEVEDNIDFLQTDNYEAFLKAYPNLDNHYQKILANKELELKVKDKINKKIEEDMISANDMCLDEKERLHHFPELVESYMNEKLKSATNVMDAYKMQGAYCQTLKDNPLDDKGLSDWVTTPALISSIGGGVVLLMNPAGIVAATAYGLVTVGGAALAVDGAQTFIENLNFIDEINQVKQLGLTDLDMLISAQDNKYTDIGISVAQALGFGIGGGVKIYRAKDKLIDLHKKVQQNRKALADENNPDAMINLVKSRHDRTIEDYKDDPKRMKNINKRNKYRKLNKFLRGKQADGERNLFNIVAAKYHTKEYLEMLKAIRSPSLKKSDDAYKDAEAMIKRYENYEDDTKKIIQDAYLARARAKELEKYADQDISPRKPIYITLPKIDANGKIVPGNRTVEYTDPGTFNEDLKRYKYEFDSAFHQNIQEEGSELIGKALLNERLLEQAYLRRKIDRMHDELKALDPEEVSDAQLKLTTRARVALKKERLFPNDENAAIQEIEEFKAEKKEFGRIVLNFVTAKQYGKNALEAPSKLSGKLAMYAGYTAVVGGTGVTAATVWFDESTQSGTIGKLRAEFKKSIDVTTRSVLDATADETLCAREWRGWSFRNACLIPLMGRYLGVELAERKFDPTKSLLNNPVARQKAREYMKFLLRLKIFDGTGEINQIIDQNLAQTAEEVALEVFLEKINRVSEQKIIKARNKLTEDYKTAKTAEEKDKIFEEAKRLIGEEAQIALRSQMITKIMHEEDPEKKQAMLEQLDKEYSEVATIVEKANLDAMAKSTIEDGHLDKDTISDLEGFITDVQEEDSILSQLNILNSPKLGKD